MALLTFSHHLCTCNILSRQSPLHHGTTQPSQHHYFPPAPNLHTNLSRAVSSLGGLAAVGATSVHLAWVRGVVAAVNERSGIPVVGVDTRQLTTVNGYNTLNVDVTLALLGALFAVSVNKSNWHWGC